MTKQKKTRFSLSEVSKFFWVSIPAMALFLLVYLARVFNPTLSQSDAGRLQVEGIENKVQYLTSLVLTTPSGEELFLNYDSEGAYLRVLGTINADEISIGANVGAEGSALL